MFFGNSRTWFFENSWVDCEKYRKKINPRKRNTTNIIQCSKCYDNFHKSQMSQIHWQFQWFLSCCEKAHDNKEFCRGNSKPHCESRITTSQVELWLKDN